MIEVITNENINKYIEYMTELPSSNIQYLGIRYGEIAVGACALVERSLSLIVDEIYIDPAYIATVSNEFLLYLLAYADDIHALILEIKVDDVRLKTSFESYGIRFKEDAISYECTVKDLLDKDRFKKIIAAEDDDLKDGELISFENFDIRKAPIHLNWVMNEPHLWKEVSYIMVKDNEVRSFCGIEKKMDDDVIEEVRLTYLYSKGAKYLLRVIKESTQNAMKQVNDETRFTFSAINENSLMLAKGFGFVDTEIRSICYRGSVITMELKDMLFYQERRL